MLDIKEQVSLLLNRIVKNPPPQILDFPGMWTREAFQHQLREQFSGSNVCVVANREPYIHNQTPTGIQVQHPASGLVTALEPIVKASAGTWLAHGSGSADKETVNADGILGVPPQAPEYTLKRLFLTEAEEDHYYYGFANEGIWPLCHIAHTRPIFRAEDWNAYVSVNAKFSEGFLSTMDSPMVHPIGLIQDYHFALLPQMIRQQMSWATLCLFWHIPWPNAEVISICPWKNELMLGMLGSDLIGFQTQYHCNNFLDSVDRFLEARVDRSRFSVTLQGHTCYVKPFPISIEWSQEPFSPESRRGIIEEYSLPPDGFIAVGVDRLDYTKGILEKFLAVERFLDSHPEFIGRFHLIQISAPSRTRIPRYQHLASELEAAIERINAKFSTAQGPIIHRVSHHDSHQLKRYYQAADLCLVTSLHDGMNLVAKEFIASRSDELGTLILSSFTGAARELTDAFIVNPYDIERCGQLIYEALTLPEAEKRYRMMRMREQVKRNNVYNWAGHMMDELHRIDDERRASERARAQSTRLRTRERRIV